MTNPKQIKDVMLAIWSNTYSNGIAKSAFHHEDLPRIAKAVIVASGAEHIPMLVKALKEICASDDVHEEWYKQIATEALNKLPKEIR
jgi:hypothetical protein